VNDLRFKIATEPDELRQIQALNYRTFVEEIPQHAPNADHMLRDRFDEENTYCICKRGSGLLGMIALRSRRPFSLDLKLPDLDRHLPPHRSACEIRLLAVEPRARQGRVLSGLIGMVYKFCEAHGHDLLLISGTLRQTRLYQHLGFVPFGPVVGTAEAPYQPMYQFLERFRSLALEAGIADLADMLRAKVNLMPGPVFLTPPVQAALGAKPVSHRSEAFGRMFDHTRRMLCSLTGAPRVAIALGSGTLANDLVAGQIAQIPGRGLILCNGEFGQRLVDHATRMGLDFDVLEAPWGQPFTASAVATAAEGRARSWLWAVHAETSTGVLNDLEMLRRVAAGRSLRLCLDCVSSLGVVTTHLAGVHLTSGVSGKGLRSIAGLALVFHDGGWLPERKLLPRYLDLRLYAAADPPFTIPSNLVGALCAALEQLDPALRYPAVRDTADWLCSELQREGLGVLAEPACRFPGAITIPLSHQLNSERVGAAAEADGWHLSYQSGYLVQRNWIQVCLLGDADRNSLDGFAQRLGALVRKQGE
jgi:aspartate aminotransferase-like enzyme